MTLSLIALAISSAVASHLLYRLRKEQATNRILKQRIEWLRQDRNDALDASVVMAQELHKLRTRRNYQRPLAINGQLTMSHRINRPLNLN